MEFLQQRFQIKYEYRVFFTSGIFDIQNETIRTFFHETIKVRTGQKVLIVLDQGLMDYYPDLVEQINQYFSTIEGVKLIEEFVLLPGGEHVKNDERWLYSIVKAVDSHAIDRHSYIVAIGGGSVLDVAGYAAAIAHRGIRHIRIPTTVLSQNDSGVGVKNGINYFTKKNFLGTFATPAAVFNDSRFLTTLELSEWRSGISEAVKVALIKDPEFFTWLEANGEKLVNRDMGAMQYLIYRCAELHLGHIAGSDPFEMGSSRPLDFGHWSAHKLEQLSGFTVRHGEAVALGIALDTVYSHLAGMLDEYSMQRVVRLIVALGFHITHPLLAVSNQESPLLRGLDEFREHLGGKLTIMLLREIGVGEEVNVINADLVRQAYEWLVEYHRTNTTPQL